MLVTASSHCPVCGNAIAQDAPRGLCGVCLAQALLGGMSGDQGKKRERWIGSWKLLNQAGEGAFGIVHEAVQENPAKRRAAVKVLKKELDSSEVKARFQMERQALILLDHPGIGRILDFGETEDGRPWFAAEWVAGARSLTDHAEANALKLRERVRLFIGVCEAVAHAHVRGIIHRDLKPANIIIDRQGIVRDAMVGYSRTRFQETEGLIEDLLKDAP